MLETAGISPDVFVLTGDLADAAEPSCYRDLAAIFAGVADRTGASAIYLPGNHDTRSAFRQSLPAGVGKGPVNQTQWREGLRIIALDSTVPGEPHGSPADSFTDPLHVEHCIARAWAPSRGDRRL